MTGDDESLLPGRLARVTEAIGPDEEGEVVVEARGGAEHWGAVAATPIPRHAPVVIVAVIDGDTLEVRPFEGRSA